MDTILVANAGSSSVKFEVFGVDQAGGLSGQLAGKIEGVGTKPHLTAKSAEGKVLVERTYANETVPHVPAALHTAGSWLRDELHIHPIAVGHRVVHGGPEFDQPVLVTDRVMDEIVRQGKHNLTVITNDTATPEKGVGKLIVAKLVRKLIVSHIGLNAETQRQMNVGELDVELVPQGTLIERIRCGGYGLGGVLTQTGIGTTVENGKQKVNANGKTYLVETALHADFALIHSFVADYIGNLGYALTARNFNPVMAMAADTVIVCADNIVPVWVMSPDHVVTPAPIVDYIITNPV
jgi:acetate CoA/acetoacetate CoA-transferase alpha subunit